MGKHERGTIADGISGQEQVQVKSARTMMDFTCPPLHRLDPLTNIQQLAGLETRSNPSHSVYKPRYGRRVNRFGSVEARHLLHGH